MIVVVAKSCAMIHGSGVFRDSRFPKCLDYRSWENVFFYSGNGKQVSLEVAVEVEKHIISQRPYNPIYYG